jgi:hypothetical protein
VAELEGLTEQNYDTLMRGTGPNNRRLMVLVQRAPEGDPHFALWRRLIDLVNQREFSSSIERQGDWFFLAPRNPKRGQRARVHIPSGTLTEIVACNTPQAVPVPHCITFATYGSLRLQLTYVAGLEPSSTEILQRVREYLDAHKLPPENREAN